MSSQCSPLQGWPGTATPPQTASATQIAPTPSVTRFWDTSRCSVTNTEVRSVMPLEGCFLLGDSRDSVTSSGLGIYTRDVSGEVKSPPQTKEQDPTVQTTLRCAIGPFLPPPLLCVPGSPLRPCASLRSYICREFSQNTLPKVPLATLALTGRITTCSPLSPCCWRESRDAAPQAHSLQDRGCF